VQTAAERFLGRTRHPGHLDGQKSLIEIVANLQGLPKPGYLNIGRRIDVDTNAEPNLADVLRRVRAGGVAVNESRPDRIPRSRSGPPAAGRQPEDHRMSHNESKPPARTTEGGGTVSELKLMSLNVSR